MGARYVDDSREAILKELDDQVPGFSDNGIGSEPDVKLIRELHPHEDAYVSFAVRSDEDFLPLLAIRSRDLSQRLPELCGRFSKDAYVSLNAAYCLARHARGSEGTPKHSTDTLRYLCCCYVDLDFYKNPGFDGHPGIVFALVRYAIDSSRIPEPSIVAMSGRGIWLLFLLRDARNPQNFQRAWPEKIVLYREIEHELVKSLRDLGADPAAVDVARYIRVPGSLHTGAERPVLWWVTRDRGGIVPSYTLPGLAQFFGVSARRRAPKRVVTGTRLSDQARNGKRRGWEALQQRRLRDFEKLREIRGGFSEGCRHYALMVYAWLLRCSRFSRVVANSRVSALAAECHPPLRSCDVQSSLKTGYGKQLQKVFDQTISNWLGITLEESQKLEKFPPALTSAECPLADHKSAEPVKHRKTEQRRALIQELISSLGRIPPTREMRRLLEDKSCHVSHVTISSDYRVLDIRFKTR